MTAKDKVESTAAATPAIQNGFSLISNEKLLAIYAAMLQCSMLQESARSHLPRSKFHDGYQAAPGQEAAIVGAAIDLLPEDALVSTQGDIIPSFIKGMPLEKLFDTSSANNGKARSARAKLNFAVRKAVVNKEKKNNKIAVVFSESGTAAQTLWLESLHLAHTQELPIIFVSLNNAEYEPADVELPGKTKNGLKKSRPVTLPEIPVDGNDVVAVYRVASESISHARQGQGPTLIQCIHSEVNNPIRNMETYLTRKGLFSEGHKAEVEGSFRKQLDAALGA